MLDNPTVVMGLADAGAHVGQIMDASQPTFFLTYWVRERGRLLDRGGVRRLTSDTAGLFGVTDRGVLAAGRVRRRQRDRPRRHARCRTPEYVHDFPGGAGRYVQRADGLRRDRSSTAQVFMEHGEHTGALAGRTVRSTD